MKRIELSDTLSMDRIVHGHWRLQDWKMSSEELLKFVEGVMDLGITTIDTADIYGGFTCEEAFGEALKLKKGLREKLTIVTKCGIVFPCAKRPQYKSHHYDNSRQHIVESAENSMRNMHTDYLDLLLIHRPSPFMDPEEVSEAFTQLHQEGKVRNFGVSNFPTSKFELLAAYMDLPLLTNQIEVSATRLDSFRNGTMDSLMARGVHPMAWSPLGGGDILTGDSERERLVRSALLAAGERFNETRLDTLAYAFLLSHPAKIMPIVGSGKLERIQNAIDALDITFNSEEWLTVFKASIGKNLP
ncbi:MAG TPA: aldo/keto reductase [Clostridiaceae bacterium]|nr:aldo/keto reductase [Clostridiaceae bacterium]